MTKSEKSYYAPREIYAKDTEKTIERLRNARLFLIKFINTIYLELKEKLKPGERKEEGKIF